MTSIETSITPPLRTAEDQKRRQHAILVIETMQRTVNAAESALTAAVDACVNEQTAEAFERARAAQYERAEAERDLAYALHHACKVEYEILTKERAAREPGCEGNHGERGRE